MAGCYAVLIGAFLLLAAVLLRRDKPVAQTGERWKPPHNVVEAKPDAAERGKHNAAKLVGWVWGVLPAFIACVLVWACWKQSRGEALRPWERRVTLAHLLALALVLGLAMAAADWGSLMQHFPSVDESFDRATE
jgi:hypothetical protein